MTHCWVKLTMFYKKGEFNFMFQHHTTCIKEFNFSYIYAASRYNITHWLTAMLKGFKHIFPLCLSTLCHKKQVIWTYIIFLYSYHVPLTSLWLFFAGVFKEFYIFGVIICQIETKPPSPIVVRTIEEGG